MVTYILCSFWFRKALHHSAKRHPSCRSEKRYHRTSPIRNRKNSNFLHRCPSTYRLQLTRVSSSHRRTHQIVSTPKPQDSLLSERILENQVKMSHWRNLIERRLKKSERWRNSSGCWYSRKSQRFDQQKSSQD